MSIFLGRTLLLATTVYSICTNDLYVYLFWGVFKLTLDIHNRTQLYSKMLKTTWNNITTKHRTVASFALASTIHILKM